MRRYDVEYFIWVPRTTSEWPTIRPQSREHVSNGSRSQRFPPLVLSVHTDALVPAYSLPPATAIQSGPTKGNCPKRCHEAPSSWLTITPPLVSAAYTVDGKLGSAVTQETGMAGKLLTRGAVLPPSLDLYSPALAATYRTWSFAGETATIRAPLTVPPLFQVAPPSGDI